MRDGTKWSLTTLWLLASLTALFVPIFVPSIRGPAALFQDTIGIATMLMYALAFPLSLIGVPLLYVAEIVLGIDPQSIGGRYLNLFVVFLLGAVQWFWIVPRLVTRRSGPVERTSAAVPELNAPLPNSFFDEEFHTPVERVIREK